MARLAQSSRVHDPAHRPASARAARSGLLACIGLLFARAHLRPRRLRDAAQRAGRGLPARRASAWAWRSGAPARGSRSTAATPTASAASPSTCAASARAASCTDVRIFEIDADGRAGAQPRRRARRRAAHAHDHRLDAAGRHRDRLDPAHADERSARRDEDSWRRSTWPTHARRRASSPPPCCRCRRMGAVDLWRYITHLAEKEQATQTLPASSSGSACSTRSPAS